MADESVAPFFWKGRGQYPRGRKIKPLPTEKRCKDCGEVKPATQFQKSHFKTKKGTESYRLEARCKACRRVWRPNPTPGYAPKPLPQERSCAACGFAKPVSEFYISRTQKRENLARKISTKCKACSRKKVRKLKAIQPIPASKRCLECGEIKPSSEFYLCKDKTSTGRPKLKLQSRCKSCRSKRCMAKAAIARIGRVRKPSKKKLPIDQPKKCSKCGEVKPPSEFGTCKRQTGVLALHSRCKTCGRPRATPEKAKAYTEKRRQKEQSDPGLLAAKKRYAAEHFQTNKERIRIRNMEARKRDPAKARIRAVANVMRRRAFGCDMRTPEIKKAVTDVLESYRIGDEYWDVYESKLIDAPTVDHVLAVTRGGTNQFENFTVTSRENNSSKGILPLLVWMAKRAARYRKDNP